MTGKEETVCPARRFNFDIFFPLLLIAISSGAMFCVLLDCDLTEYLESFFWFGLVMMTMSASLAGVIVTIARIVNRKTGWATLPAYLLAFVSGILLFMAWYMRDDQLTLEYEMRIATVNKLSENPIRNLGVKLGDSRLQYYVLCDYKYGFGIFVVNQNGAIGAKYYIPSYRSVGGAIYQLGECKDKQEMKRLIDSILTKTRQDPFKLSFGMRKQRNMDMPTEQANRWIKDGLDRMSEHIQEL